MNSLIHKSRKPKFELNLKIIDLNNVPLVSGTSFVKWHIPSSISAEHRGRTTKEHIKEHKVVWDYETTLPVRMSMDRSNLLHEFSIHFEVMQDYGAHGGRGEKIRLGQLSLNLAEYADMQDDDGEDGVTRRYLMMDSKINSTLKIGINMRQVEGDKNFVAPPLKTAPVFGGIAGIMAGEGEQDDLGQLPTMNKSREAGELQDMYRRSLAASWGTQAGEFTADKCIEDIFNGGSGWKNKESQDKIAQPRQTLAPGSQQQVDEDTSPSQPNHRHHSHHRRTPSSNSGRSVSTVRAQISSGGGHRHKNSEDLHGHKRNAPIRGVLEEAHHHQHHRELSFESLDARKQGYKHAQEVNELNVRNDLVAWSLRGAS